MMKYILEIENLKQEFRRKGSKTVVKAIRNLSLKLELGKTYGLVGESGCGKSTTIRSVAHLHKPSAGKISFEGTDLSTLDKKEFIALRKDMQIVFQDPYEALNPRMTIRQIISEPLVIYKNKEFGTTRAFIDAKVEEAMDLVGLPKSSKSRFPHEFSGGQRQRINIARALILQPKLIMLDEPVSALDVSIQSQVLNLLKDLQGQFNLTYLFISHDLAVVRYVSDHIGVMYLGELVESAPVTELYKEPLHPYTQSLIASIPSPKPRKERKAQLIIGEIAGAESDAPGCPFYDRCYKRMEKCLNTKPKLEKVSIGTQKSDKHLVSCFLYQD